MTVNNDTGADARTYGDEYRAVPFSNTEENNQSMEIGYITRKNQLLGKIGNIYIKNIRQYLML